MPLGDESFGVVIAGAASLRGKDLKQYAQESGFPAGEIRLIDEELAVGTLTDVGGEPAVIQRVDESSFEQMRFVFFAGSPQFSEKHGAAAMSTKATVIDLSSGLSGVPGARPWIPRLDGMLPTPAPSEEDESPAGLYLAPSTPAIVAIGLSAAFSELSLKCLAVAFFVPVSERGQAGVDELENQTTKLLSFQPIPQKVFDTQVAFNMVDRWGPESGERLPDRRSALESEVHAYLAGRAFMPAMTLIQAPVFYGNAFSVYAEFGAIESAEFLTERLAAGGFTISEDGSAPSNISVAGEAHPMIGRPERNPNVDCGYWFWGAADNLRVASANAMRIAETLLAT